MSNRPLALLRGLPRLLAVAATLTAGAIGGLNAATKPPPVAVELAYITRDYPEPPPLSLLVPIVDDEGLAGARLGLKENNLTGRLLGQSYAMSETRVARDGDLVAAAAEILKSGTKIIVADLNADDLLKLADMPEARDAILFNIRESDVSLRMDGCRANLFHIIPDYAMRADALGQYLAWKRWDRWLVVKGKEPADAQFASMIERAAERFGAKVVEERTYAFEAGSRRIESGHQQIQTQMPMATQGAPEHDVIFVADTGEAFGEYLAYRSFEPRPVVGTHGLTAVMWHRAFEQFGGLSLQSSFERLAGRWMRERDYAGWMAVKVVGEAVTRGQGQDPAAIRTYILDDGFKIGGHKGLALNFRTWDHQMRQPIPVMGPRALVSISPQDGFLHPSYVTDTLGFDAPESACHLENN